MYHTEEEFRKAINTKPYEHTLRLIFADWLDEQNDPRAEGYRAMGTLRILPIDYGLFSWWDSSSLKGQNDYDNLHHSWFIRLKKGVLHKQGWIGFYRDYETRKEAEDDAALAFALLTTRLKTIVPKAMVRPYATNFEE